MTNLLETLESWTEDLDQGCGTDAVFLDYQKAIDIVPHDRLIGKLSGIRGQVLHWIKGFLTNRRMRT